MKRFLVLLLLTFGFFWVGVGFWLLNQPKIVVVPHHNVVVAIRKEFLISLSRQRLMTNRIILISTDHFGKNQHRILTTSPNEAIFPLAAADNEALYADHGIMNIVPDIAAIFPQAAVYPLLIGNEVRVSELTTLLSHIRSQCGMDCMVIASVDFSHYLPAAVAMTHDVFSIQSLENLDAAMIWKAETDSPQALWLAIQLAQRSDALRWMTYAQTNSSLMIHDPWYESTSHVFGWYQGGPYRKVTEVKTFTVIQASSSAGLASLGNRLTYGTNNAKISCEIPLASEIVMTGWETRDALYVGILPLGLTPKGYMWKRQEAHLPALDCNKPVILLPGTVN